MAFLLGIVIAIVIVAVTLPLAKKTKLGLNARQQVTLRPGETLIASMLVTWKHKRFYFSRYSIPTGTLDITDQRVVFTATSGKRVNFEVEKDDIADVRSAGLFADIRTKGGDSYLLGTSWKKELKGYLRQMGAPVS